MSRAFKSERHMALNSTFPADGSDRLLSTGVLAGPYRRPRPFTLTRRMRFLRWLRSVFTLRSPL